MNKTYTLGEIIRLGLLKNNSGEPYKHRGTIQKLLVGKKRVQTPWGLGYAITQQEIDELNSRWEK